MNCTRKARIKALEARRESRRQHNPNLNRKARYSALAGKLGNGELADYKGLRTAILAAALDIETESLEIHLPAENPARCHYDLARKIYYSSICPKDEEE